MAEGGIIKRLFGAEEGEEGEAENLGQPVADALALDLAGGSEEARSYLRRAERLVKIQTEHLHEQREVLLSHLKIRRFTERLKAGTQLFVVAAAAVVGICAVSALYDAISSRAVVVDVFKVPSTLASRGVTGDVVAAAVLDSLQKLQEATRSDDKGLKTRGTWTSDIKIEVPETGVSISEVNRLLHERLGHDVHIDGDLVQTDTGKLSLTVRGDSVPASTFEGNSGDLDKLTTQAAEYIYGRSQPLRYARYLDESHRYNDAQAFLPGAFARADDNEDRAKIAALSSGVYVDTGEYFKSMQKLRLAIALHKKTLPIWWSLQANLVFVTALLNGEESGWIEGQALLKRVDATRMSLRPPAPMLANSALFTWDPQRAIAASLEDAKLNSGAGSGFVMAGPTLADEYALVHDPDQAESHISASDPDDLATKAEILLLKGYALLDRGDAADAIVPLLAYNKMWSSNKSLQFYSYTPCFLGLAYGLTGRVGDADLIFNHISTPWSLCYAFHGQVLAKSGDLIGAQRVWTDGIKLMPDLPNVYLSRAQWEMSHSKPKEAEIDLSTATQKAPHFADSFKIWGDLLGKEGRWKDALAKYDVAVKYAPAWAELHRARKSADDQLLHNNYK